MRIATWNINGLRARLDFVLIWLNERQPDIVGLQELKITDDEFPHEPFNAIGYHVQTHGQKGWNGVAVVSKNPVEIVQRACPGKTTSGIEDRLNRPGEDTKRRLGRGCLHCPYCPPLLIRIYFYTPGWNTGAANRFCKTF